MINDLVKRAYENSKKHGFWNEEKNFGEVIALMHSELSEALKNIEMVKKSMKYIMNKEKNLVEFHQN